MKLAKVAIMFLLPIIVKAEFVTHGSSPFSLRPIVITVPEQSSFIPSYYRLPSIGNTNLYNPSIVGFGQSYQLNPFINQYSVDSRIPFLGSGTIANSGFFGFPGVGTYSPNLGYMGINPYDYSSDFLTSDIYNNFLNTDYNFLYPNFSSFDYDPFWDYSLMTPTYFDYPSYYWNWWNDPTTLGYSYPYNGYWDFPYGSWGFDTSGGMVDWYTPWASGFVNW